MTLTVTAARLVLDRLTILHSLGVEGVIVRRAGVGAGACWRCPWCGWSGAMLFAFDAQHDVVVKDAGMALAAFVQRHAGCVARFR